MSRSLYNSIKIVWKTSPFDCVLLIIIELILSIFPSISLLINKRLIEGVSNKDNFLSVIFVMILYVLTIFLSRTLANWFHRYYITYYSLLSFEKRMKKKLSDICEKFELEDFYNSEIQNASIRAKNASINFFRIFQAYIQLVSSIIGVFAISGFVFSINTSLWIAILSIGISSILEQIFTIKVEKKNLYVTTQDEKERQEIGDFLINSDKFKEVSLYKAFDFLKKEWEMISSRINKYGHKRNKDILYVSIPFKILSLLFRVGGYYYLFILFQKNYLTIADFAISLSAFVSVDIFFESIFIMYKNISTFLVLTEPYFDYEKIADNLKNRYEKVFREKLKKIELKNISYKYPNSKEYALKNISLKIQEGESIYLVGENGAGKTTLIKLVLGLIEASSGVVLYNDKDISKYDKNTIFDFISTLTQNYNIYNISLTDNITFGGNNIDLEQEFYSLNLGKLFAHRNKIYGKEFAGIELSEGQKQKIALLRASHKPSCLITFDEPTSAIDPIQEKEIMDLITKIGQGKFSIIVSHKYIKRKYANKIVVMERGRIVESGNHQELIDKHGIYYDLCMNQVKQYK